MEVTVRMRTLVALALAVLVGRWLREQGRRWWHYAQQPSSAPSELAVDPYLASLVRGLRQAAALRHAAGDGEFPAAAGQEPCGEQGPPWPDPDHDGAPRPLSCTRPTGHEPPHAHHRPSDLVDPVAVWHEAS